MAAVPSNLIAPQEFIMVNPELVKFMGGKVHLAVVWEKIRFRCNGRTAVHDEDGDWWECSYADMSDLTGMSAYACRRAVAQLESQGFIESCELKLADPKDRTKAYRPVISGPTSTGGESAISGGSKGESAKGGVANPPVDTYYIEEDNKEGGTGKRKAKAPVPLPDDWQPSQKLVEKAVALKVNWPQEVEKMRRWAFAKDVKRKDWDATFRSWIANARPTEEPIPTTVRTSGFRAWFASVLESANTGEVERVLGLVFPMPDEVPAGVSRVEFLDDCRRAWLESVEVQAESRWVVQFGDVLKGP